jgi:hypothetical protein
VDPRFVNATVRLINVVSAARHSGDPFYSIRSSIPVLDDVRAGEVLQHDRVVVSSVVPGSLVTRMLCDTSVRARENGSGAQRIHIESHGPLHNYQP